LVDQAFSRRLDWPLDATSHEVRRSRAVETLFRSFVLARARALSPGELEKRGQNFFKQIETTQL